MKIAILLGILATIVIAGCAETNLVGEGINARTGEQVQGDTPGVFFYDGARIVSAEEGLEVSVRNNENRNWFKHTFTRDGHLEIDEHLFVDVAFTEEITTSDLFLTGAADITADQVDFRSEDNIRLLTTDLVARTESIELSGDFVKLEGEVEIEGRLLVEGVVEYEGGQPGSVAYRFDGYDETDRILIFRNHDTGDERVVTTQNGTTENFVHEGRSYLMRYNFDKVLSIDVDRDGQYDTLVFEGNTFELPRFR